MNSSRQLEMYVVYDKTTIDYPGKYVIRRFVDGAPDMEPLIVGDTLEGVLSALPPGLSKLARSPYDEPVILEVWLGIS